MIEWTRPSGSTIETNDDQRNIEAAELLGWKRKDQDKKEFKKDRKKEVQTSLLGD